MPDEEREAPVFDEFVSPTRIAGVGPGQRPYVERLQPGDELILERETGEGPGDPVRVLDPEGNTLGHIPSGANEQVAAILELGDEGVSVRAVMNYFAGGGTDESAIDANILLFFHSNRDVGTLDSMMRELQGTIRRDGGIWFEREAEAVWYPAVWQGAEDLDTEEKHTLRNAFMTLVSLLVIIGLLLLVVLGIRRPAPEDRQAPPPPVRAAEALVDRTHAASSTSLNTPEAW